MAGMESQDRSDLRLSSPQDGALDARTEQISLPTLCWLFLSETTSFFLRRGLESFTTIK